MSLISVKICGITEERDAIEAAHLGVDAVGFHFASDSPRYIEPEAARGIVDRLPVFLSKVGVFRGLPLIRVLEVARRAGVTAVQFDGDENPGLCAGVAPLGWYKTFRVDGDFDPGDLGAYGCRTFLLRASPATAAAGPGRFAWRQARALSIYGDILIGGGLDPMNVGLAIEDARPRGVDVLAGVEFAPGKKDLNRLELFVEAVRRAERRIQEEDRRA